MLEITVHKIIGKCPVYKEGDKIIIDDPEIVLEKQMLFAHMPYLQFYITQLFWRKNGVLLN